MAIATIADDGAALHIRRAPTPRTVTGPCEVRVALTISVLREDGEADEMLSLTLDAPRVVIGRSKSCELMLLDPSVSARHACIRREGGRNLIVDEGSTNGIMVDNVLLPAHTPRAIQDGEMVRVGRVWLQLHLAAGMPSPSGAREQLATELLRRDRLAEGEPLQTELRVIEGPDAGATLALEAGEREYRLGRSRQADLVLRDEHSSRIHALVVHRQGRWTVRDNGSKRGSLLGGEPLGDEPVRWRPEAQLQLGDTIIELFDPLPAATAEALSEPDLRMRPDEQQQPPPGSHADSAPAPVQAPSEAQQQAPSRAPTPTPSPALDIPRDPRGAGYVSIDLVVILIALAVIGLSAVGLWWVLG